MNIAGQLPVELWLIIFEMVLDPASDPSCGCSHRTFPEIHYRLCSPWTCVPMDLSRQTLRLVSRTFNNMVNTCSDSVLVNNNVTSITSKSRSVCISRDIDPVAGLCRLLREPVTCSRIVTLVMPIQFVRKPDPIMGFDLLCDSGLSLPSMRRLTLVHRFPIGAQLVTNLWSRVNASFPLLTCLVLGNIINWENEYTVTTFNRLEVLDVHHLGHVYGVRFPLLRHVAVLECTDSELGILERSRHLESMLIHRIPRLSRAIDWKSFKKLRLLGIPLKDTPWIISFPPDHPLELLYVYTNPREGKQGPDVVVQMVKKMVICLPTVTQIHIDIETLPKSRQASLQRYLKSSRLKEWGLHVRPMYTPSYQMVVERIPETAEGESQLEPLTLGGALKRGLSKLSQFGFRRQLV